MYLYTALKKPVAILFLTLFLFNLIGYKCYFYYLQQKENASFEATLDKEAYNEKDLITFKVPLSLPYQVSWKDFERVDGEITIEGTLYKYVKRKIEDGQLILLCLPYYKKMDMVKAAAEFGSHGNDWVPFGKKDTNTSPGKNNSPNEYEENSSWLIHSRPQDLIKQYTRFLLPHLKDGFITFPGKPPELG